VPSPFKVHELLSSSELDELKIFAREPGRSIDELHQWLLERQFTLSRSSVGRWMLQFREEMLSERFAESTGLAAAMKEAVAAGKGFDSVAEATAMQLTQVVFEQATALQAEQKIDPLDVQRMTRSLLNLTNTKEKLSLRFDKEAAAKVQASPTRTITAEDLAEIRKSVFG